ncbi:MAG: hypothetical protein WD490_00765 [Opitutales bacterium]
MKRKTKVSGRSIEYYRTKIEELEARLAELRRNIFHTRRRSAGVAAQSDEGAARVTSITAKVDVGFGNHLYIRGQGGGLSWEKGVLMQCEAPDLWRWNSDPGNGPIVFKLLVNDQHWAIGENAQVEPGEERVLEPGFEYVS